MSIAVITAQTIGPIIGYIVNLTAIHHAKETLKKLVVTEEDISDELVKAISLMESGKFEQGVDQLIGYRAANASTIGFRVVKELYVNELKSVSSKLKNIIQSQNNFLKGLAYSFDGKVERLIKILTDL